MAEDNENLEVKAEAYAVAPDPNSYQVGGSHYQGDYQQQHWDYAWERQFDYFQGVITKYVERWRRKGGVEDLEKAQHYLTKYISLVKAAEQRASATASSSGR